MDFLNLVFRKDVRGGEAGFWAILEEIFFSGDLHLGPTVRSNTDNSTGPNGFNDKIGLEMDVYAAAAHGNLATCLLYSNDFTARGHVSRAIVACRVLQSIFRTIDLSTDILFEVIIKSGVHSSEQSSGYGSSTELAISYFFDPAGHPATSDKGIVLLGLKIGRVFNGFVI